MQEAARRAKYPASESDGPETVEHPLLCAWTLVDRHTTVELRWDAAAAAEALSRGSGRGLLLGEVRSGFPRRITIDGIHPVDLGIPGGVRRIVGIYRPAQGDSFKPGEEERRLLRGYCPSPPALLLLTLDGAPLRLGGLFLWDEQGMDAECRMLLPLEQYRGGVPDPAPAEPLAARRPAASSPVLWALRAIYGLSLILAAGAVVTIWRDAGGSWQPRAATVKAPAKAANPPAVIEPELTVSFSGQRMRVLWNPAAPAIQTATRAYLTVNDGGKLKEIPLSRSALLSGGVFYDPKTPDLTIALHAISPGGEYWESVRVLEPQP
jgi:hypothetical protein